MNSAETPRLSAWSKRSHFLLSSLQQAITASRPSSSFSAFSINELTLQFWSKNANLSLPIRGQLIGHHRIACYSSRSSSPSSSTSLIRTTDHVTPTTGCGRSISLKRPASNHRGSPASPLHLAHQRSSPAIQGSSAGRLPGPPLHQPATAQILAPMVGPTREAQLWRDRKHLSILARTEDRVADLLLSDVLQPHEQADVLSVWAPDVHAVPASSALRQFAVAIGVVVLFGSTVYAATPQKPALPRVSFDRNSNGPR